MTNDTITCVKHHTPIRIVSGELICNSCMVEQTYKSTRKEQSVNVQPNDNIVAKAYDIKTMAENALMGSLDKTQLSEVCRMIVYANKVIKEAGRNQ